MTGHIDFGIDLGTTNSCIARYAKGDVEIFQNNEQMNVTPSVVHALRSGRLLVGRRAYDGLVRDPNNAVRGFKRWMGQDHHQSFPAANLELTPEELSAEVLKALKEDATRRTGAEVTESVVTVPAAFDALQCEATARAANLAGLENAPLLQEPIAAAIAYGADPSSKDQTWLVFDLGGGTFDVAIVSTHGGRLSVLEHEGDNLLGGGDLDRDIVRQILLPRLRSQFSLPNEQSNGRLRSLQHRLERRAEEAKIDLSLTDRVPLALFDLGDDEDGRPIETDIELTRSEIERLADPLIDRCLELTKTALNRADLQPDSLDRVVLVGGPTQMPRIRERLSETFSADVDFSIDPMTVVARGAALFAGNLESARQAASASEPSSDGLSLELAFEASSPDVQCIVAGRFSSQASAEPPCEVRVDAEGGYWTSGWLPVDSTTGAFELEVVLQDGSATTFYVYARDGSARLLDFRGGEFEIRHGMTVAAPPLPHTLSVEVQSDGSGTRLDPVFPRNTPLPCETVVKYRAERTLDPGTPDDALVIKLWEGEILDDPQANNWVYNLELRSSEITRSIPEGTQIELAIKLDASRLLTAEAHVPRLDQDFSGGRYLKAEQQQDYGYRAAELPDQLEKAETDLDEIQREVPIDDVDETRAEVEELRNELARLRGEAHKAGDQTTDPDQARRLVEQARRVRGKISDLKARHSPAGSGPVRASEAEQALAGTRGVVDRFGDSEEREQLELLTTSLRRAVRRGDEREIEHLVTALQRLYWQVLWKQDWFWRQSFDALRDSGGPWVNAAEADRWISEGLEAIRVGNGTSLREAVRRLWKLQPQDVAQAERDRLVRAGVRKY